MKVTRFDEVPEFQSGWIFIIKQRGKVLLRCSHLSDAKAYWDTHGLRTAKNVTLERIQGTV